MDTFIATNFKVKKAQAEFNPSYDVFKTPKGRYLIYDHRKRDTKLASDLDFEQNFFQLAFTYIKDKIPTLIDFMVGFEVVDKNEEGTQALGLFMFEVRERKFYVPIMYSNGELKGADLLYDNEADRFIPNKDNWVDHVLSQSPTEAGFAAKEDEEDLDFSNPNITELFDNNPYKSSNVPLVGEAGLNDLVEEGGDIVAEEDESTDDDSDTPATDAATDKSDIKDASAFNRMLKVGQAPQWGSLTDFFRNEDGNFASKFAQTLMREPKLHEAAYKFYGEDIYEALADAKFAQDSADLPKVASEEPKIKVITSPMDSGVEEILNEEEIQSLVEDGIAFVDNRGEDEKAIPYKVETDVAISSPSEAGIYSVLMSGGVFKEMAVFPNLLGSKASTSDVEIGYGGDSPHKTSLLVDSSNATATPANPKDILVDVTEAPGKFIDYVEKLPTTSAINNSKIPKYDATVRDVDQYIFVDTGSYQATPPLTIQNKVTTDGVVSADAYSHSTGPLIERVIIGDKYTGLSYSSGTLYANPDCKVIKVKQPEYTETLALGNQEDLDKTLLRDFEDIKVSCVGYDEYHVFGPNTTVAFCRHKKALTTLVSQFGLGAGDARQMISDAKKDGVKVAKYKLAGPAEMTYPAYEDGASFTTNPVLGVQEQTSTPQFIPAMQSGSEDPQSAAIQDSITGMNQTQGDPMSSQSVQEVLQAAQTGEREVFDTSTISNLLDANEIDSLLTRFTKDLDIGLDRLGRLHFLLMLHRDKFTERFGSEDILNIEEALNNTFKGLGELVLKLKEREISSDSGFAVETDLAELA